MATTTNPVVNTRVSATINIEIIPNDFQLKIPGFNFEAGTEEEENKNVPNNSAFSVFNFDPAHKIRVFIKNNDLSFVAKDVCDILGLDNVSKAVLRLDDDEKDDLNTRDTIGRSQKMTTINESGLYTLILTSRKEEAKKFKRWITHEVIPAIRKTGSYKVVNELAIIPAPDANTLYRITSI